VHRKAIELTNSPLLLLDAMFNMALGYISLADQLEDLIVGSDPISEVEILGLREEAGRVLQDVMDGQEEFLKRQASPEDAEGEEVEVNVDAGENVDGEESKDLGSEVEAGMDVDDEAQEDASGEEEEGTFETYLPTRSTYIDTALLLVDVHLSIWESSDPPCAPQNTAQAHVRTILDRAAQIVPPGRQADLDLAEIKVLLAVDRIVWDMYRVEARAGSGAEKSIEGAIKVLDRLYASLDDQPPDEATTRAEILTVLADTHSALANRSAWLLSQLPAGPSPLAQQAWYHYSQAISVLGKALDLPTSPHTPRDFKPSVLLSLSQASLSRAKLAIGAVNDTAQRNAVQLMENAVNYAGRAADGLGWKGANIRASSSTLSLSTGITVPHQAGWDTESLARNSLLQLLRICYFGSKTEILSESDRPGYAAPAERLIGSLQKLAGERKIDNKAVAVWLQALEEDERIEEDEKAWWGHLLPA
jgi:hypothetical protein